MNLLHRIIARWWSIWAIFVGVDTVRSVPLPRPLVDPRRPAADLIAEADAHGAADGAAVTHDHWSFGAPHEPPSELFDPEYVRQLRHQRDAAIEALRQSQRITHDRLGPVRRMRDEESDRMDDARSRMAGLAVRDSALEAIRTDDLDGTGTAPDPTVTDGVRWEGETNPLGLGWRLLILVGLVVAEVPVQFAVFGHVFAGEPELGRRLATVTSAVVVFAPFIAGTLIRNRQASTAERRILHTILVLAVAWLAVVGLIGFLRGRLMDTPGHLTPVTIVLMFVALLVVVGAMAFMLGLARRHPFQEAYARHRRHRDRFGTLIGTMAARMNPAYREHDDPVQATEEGSRAIREAYAAAEDAYFAALTRAFGDPTFTEAVQQRRGLREPAPAGQPPGA